MNQFPIRLIVLMIFSLLLGTTSVYCQEYHGGVVMPAYKGGSPAIKEVVTGNLVFPDSVKMKGINGSVLVKISINTEGKVENLKLMRGFYPYCDAEAMRVAGLLKDWIPAENWGTPVNCDVLLPVEFQGENNSVQSPVVITGSVYDINSGKPLSGALILIKGTNVGTISGSDGRYMLEINSDNCDMDISYVGYNTKTEHVGSSRTIHVELEKGYYYLNY